MATPKKSTTPTTPTSSSSSSSSSSKAGRGSGSARKAGSGSGSKAGHAAAPTSKMTDEHKMALARGRTEGRAVRDYLDALRRNKPTRGRQRTPASIERRLTTIDGQMADADAVTQLRLVQERRDLAEALARIEAGFDMAAVEDAFVATAAGYSARHGIAYASWREVGVPASVLKRAGLSRRS